MAGWNTRLSGAAVVTALAFAAAWSTATQPVLAATAPVPTPSTVMAPTVDVPSVVTTMKPSTTTRVREPGSVQVAAACPGGVSYANAAPGSADVIEIVKAQSNLATTIAQVQQYATTQPATFGELRFGGPFNGVVVVSFTSDLATHAAALSTIVDVPNGVVVCPATEAASTKLALANELIQRINGAFTTASLTPQTGPPVIMLKANRRALAEALVHDYGSRVKVFLGEFGYPDPAVARDSANLAPMPCGTVPKAGPSSAALRWTVPKLLRTDSGGDITTQVTMRNASKRPVTFDSGDPITGVVTAVGSNVILARFNGAIAGIGFGATLRPGERATVNGLASTASCDITLGYALPPGRYSVRFVFGGYDYSANGGTKAERFVSTPIPLTITNEPPPPLPTSESVPMITLPGAGGGGPGATLAARPATTRA